MAQAVVEPELVEPMGVVVTAVELVVEDPGTGGGGEGVVVVNEDVGGGGEGVVVVNEDVGDEADVVTIVVLELASIVPGTAGLLARHQFTHGSNWWINFSTTTGGVPPLALIQSWQPIKPS